MKKKNLSDRYLLQRDFASVYNKGLKARPVRSREEMRNLMVLAGRGRALALTAVLALAAVGVWSLASRADTGIGAGSSTSGGSRYTISTGPLQGPSGLTGTGIFVLDAQTLRLVVYSATTGGMLKLVAVRDISEDVRVLQYNNDHPWPDEMRSRMQTGGGERAGSATKAEK